MVGGTSQEKRFASLGHRDLAETGLDPTLFRMFSSTQGRWLGRDPLLGTLTDPQTLNRYSYLRNCPAAFTDPLGLYWGCVGKWALGGALGGGIAGGLAGCLAGAPFAGPGGCAAVGFVGIGDGALVGGIAGGIGGLIFCE